MREREKTEEDLLFFLFYKGLFLNVLVLIKYFSDLNFVMLKFHLKLPQAKKFKYGIYFVHE